MRWKINPRPTARCRNRIQELNGSEGDTCSTSRTLTETSDFCVIWPYRGTCKSCMWWKSLHAWTDYKPGYASIPALAGLALHHAVDLGLNLRIGSTFLNANRHSYSITYVERYVSRMSDKQKDLKSPAHPQKKPVTHVECHTGMPQRSVGGTPAVTSHQLVHETDVPHILSPFLNQSIRELHTYYAYKV
jgi:hypothetical protein